MIVYWASLLSSCKEFFWKNLLQHFNVLCCGAELKESLSRMGQELKQSIMRSVQLAVGSMQRFAQSHWNQTQKKTEEEVSYEGGLHWTLTNMLNTKWKIENPQKCILVNYIYLCKVLPEYFNCLRLYFELLKNKLLLDRWKKRLRTWQSKFFKMNRIRQSIMKTSVWLNYFLYLLWQM